MSGKKAIVLPALLMAAPVAAIVYFSIGIIGGSLRTVPGAQGAGLTVLVCLWALGLPVLLLKPLNVAVLRLAGARSASPGEFPSLDRTWHKVLARAGVAPARYALMVVDEGVLLDRDLGSHVVTIDSASAWSLDEAELPGLLAQRLSRQASGVSLLLGVCVWLALPLVLFLYLAYLIASFGYAIARGAGSAASRNLPRSDEQLGCWAVLLVIALFAGGLALVMSLTILFYLVLALVVLVATAWLARTAEVTAGLLPVRWGYRSELVAAFTEISEDETGPAGWRRLFSTTATPRAHIKRLQRLGSRPAPRDRSR